MSRGVLFQFGVILTINPKWSLKVTTFSPLISVEYALQAYLDHVSLPVWGCQGDELLEGPILAPTP